MLPSVLPSKPAVRDISSTKEDIEKALLPLLKKGETVLEALQRVGAKAKKNAPQQKKRYVATPMNTTVY